MAEAAAVWQYLDAWGEVFTQTREIVDAWHYERQKETAKLAGYDPVLQGIAIPEEDVGMNAAYEISSRSPVAVKLEEWLASLRELYQLMQHHENIETQVAEGKGGMLTQIGREQRVRGRLGKIESTAAALSVAWPHQAREAVAGAVNRMLGRSLVPPHAAFGYSLREDGDFTAAVAALPEEKAQETRRLAAAYDGLGDAMEAFMGLKQELTALTRKNGRG